MITVEYNGHMISDYMIINSLDRGIGSPRTNNLKKLGMSRGEQYISHTSGTIKITMKFTLISNLVEKRRELAGIMDVSEPARLIFSDEPDKYYMAVPDGEITFDDSRRYGTGVITWVVPDGLAHSTTTKQFTAVKNSNGVLELTINNEGTAAVPIDYKVVHNHDNGYLGFVSENGVLQTGKIQEVDGHDYQQAEQLFSTVTFSEFERDTGADPENPDRATDGVLAQIGIDNVPGLILQTPSASSGWGGGMVTLDVPKNSEGKKPVNWWSYFNICFESDQMNQLGCMVVRYLDAEGGVICSYTVEKNTTTNKASTIIRVGGTEVYRSAFPAGSNDKENPLTKKRGHCDMLKEGATITGTVDGTRRGAFVQRLANVACDKIQLYIAGYGMSPSLTRSYFKLISMRDNIVEKWADIPNRYPSGSEIVIDGKESKIYMDGILRMDDEVKGSQYFLAPPGQSKIQVYCSDFSIPAPTVTAEIREAWT